MISALVLVDFNAVEIQMKINQVDLVQVLEREKLDLAVAEVLRSEIMATMKNELVLVEQDVKADLEDQMRTVRKDHSVSVQETTKMVRRKKAEASDQDSVLDEIMATIKKEDLGNDARAADLVDETEVGLVHDATIMTVNKKVVSVDETTITVVDSEAKNEKDSAIVDQVDSVGETTKMVSRNAKASALETGLALDERTMTKTARENQAGFVAKEDSDPEITMRTARKDHLVSANEMKRTVLREEVSVKDSDLVQETKMGRKEREDLVSDAKVEDLVREEKVAVADLVVSAKRVVDSVVGKVGLADAATMTKMVKKERVDSEVNEKVVSVATEEMIKKKK